MKKIDQILEIKDRIMIIQKECYSIFDELHRMQIEELRSAVSSEPTNP